MIIRINWTKITHNLSDDLLYLSALIAIWGALVYYLYALNWPGIIISLILTGASFFGLRRFWVKDGLSDITSSDDKTEGSVQRRDKFFVPLYGLLYLLLIIVLINGQSERAIVSPWQSVNAAFFWLYSLASLVLILILIRTAIRPGCKILLISLHYLISLAVAVIVYKIGYGFDPFIHEATMKLIAAKGLVEPKTPYYLGEYSLIIIGHKLSGLAIGTLNKILVPVMAAFFIPTAVYRFLQKEKVASFLTVSGLLALTFSPFILTTPQNLSYLFLILTVLAGSDYPKLSRVWILALATAAIHPLTGLPALILAGGLTFKKYQTKINANWHTLIAITLFSAMAGALPLALLLAGGGHWPAGGINWANWFAAFKNLWGTPGSVGQEDWLANFLYFIGNNYSLWLGLALGAALVYHYRQRRQEEKNYQAQATFKQSLLTMSAALFLAYLLSSQIIFNNLISYEQSDYANRLPIIIIIFLLPFLISGGNEVCLRIRRQNTISQLIFLLAGIGIISASLYLSYPRWDKYWNSRGYSTSSDDLAAVELIARQTSTPYIVLADQQVSAAALRELGFNHYYQSATGPIYFYPIPTGAPLYQYYLKMVYKNPSPANMDGALALVGVKTGYLIINRYWYNSNLRIEEAKLQALKWWTINNQVYIFLYQRP